MWSCCPIAEVHLLKNVTTCLHCDSHRDTTAIVYCTSNNGRDGREWRNHEGSLIIFCSKAVTTAKVSVHCSHCSASQWMERGNSRVLPSEKLNMYLMTYKLRTRQTSKCGGDESTYTMANKMFSDIYSFIFQIYVQPYACWSHPKHVCLHQTNGQQKEIILSDESHLS